MFSRQQSIYLNRPKTPKFGKSHFHLAKCTHEAKMMPADVRGFARVVRRLVQGFHGWHAAGFFAHFDAVAQYESPSGNHDQGIMVEHDSSPLSQEEVELPGGGPEKVQDEVIAVGTQEEPTDNTGNTEMIAANEQAEDNDDKPLKGCLA
jgi:hypothetical protein